jgi:hypothetical protein
VFSVVQYSIVRPSTLPIPERITAMRIVLIKQAKVQRRRRRLIFHSRSWFCPLTSRSVAVSVGVSHRVGPILFIRRIIKVLILCIRSLEGWDSVHGRCYRQHLAGRKSTASQPELRLNCEHQLWRQKRM